jgi:hypothetical protein
MPHRVNPGSIPSTRTIATSHLERVFGGPP